MFESETSKMVTVYALYWCPAWGSNLNFDKLSVDLGLLATSFFDAYQETKVVWLPGFLKYLLKRVSGLLMQTRAMLSIRTKRPLNSTPSSSARSRFRNERCQLAQVFTKLLNRCLEQTDGNQISVVDFHCNDYNVEICLSYLRILT